MGSHWPISRINPEWEAIYQWVNGWSTSFTICTNGTDCDAAFINGIHLCRLDVSKVFSTAVLTGDTLNERSNMTNGT